MTNTSNKVFGIYLKTPNHDWNIVVPHLMLLKYFIELTIVYEQLDSSKTWKIFDLRDENTPITLNETYSIGYHNIVNPSNNDYNFEFEIKEIV